MIESWNVSHYDESGWGKVTPDKSNKSAFYEIQTVNYLQNKIYVFLNALVMDITMFYKFISMKSLLRSRIQQFVFSLNVLLVGSQKAIFLRPGTFL